MQRIYTLVYTIVGLALLTPVPGIAQEPVMGAGATVQVFDFPNTGDHATIDWNASTQLFEVVAVRTPVDRALGAPDFLFLQAVGVGNVAGAQSALDAGASLHAREAAQGETALFATPTVAMAQWLLDEGASVHTRNTHGMTPLHDQVIRGRTAVVQVLLEAGANVNARDERGMTPLQWVESPALGVSPASEEMLALLREYGAM